MSNISPENIIAIEHIPQSSLDVKNYRALIYQINACDLTECYNYLDFCNINEFILYKGVAKNSATKLYINHNNIHEYYMNKSNIVLYHDLYEVMYFSTKTNKLEELTIECGYNPKEIITKAFFDNLDLLDEL